MTRAPTDWQKKSRDLAAKMEDAARVEVSQIKEPDRAVVWELIDSIPAMLTSELVIALMSAPDTITFGTTTLSDDDQLAARTLIVLLVARELDSRIPVP